MTEPLPAPAPVLEPLTRYREMQPYVAGKPIEEVARELGLERIVKLASNENPYPPFPGVLDAAAAAMVDANRYPDDDYYDLINALAARLAIAPDCFALGAGSSDVIQTAWRIFAGAGDRIVHAWPSFVMYPLVAAYGGAESAPIPLTAAFAHDLDRLVEESRHPRTRVVVVCNPNNPTGGIVGHDDLVRFIDEVRTDVLVHIDEAYYEFADDPSYPRLIPEVLDRPNVLVTRTFSKIYGLAGLRCGYGIGNPRLIASLRKGRGPFVVSRPAAAAAVASLPFVVEVAARARANTNERDRLLPELARRGFSPAPTQGNFVWLSPPDERDWFDLLLHEGVIIRPMPGGLRVTFGTPDEDDFLLAGIDAVAARPSSAALESGSRSGQPPIV